MKDFEIIVIAPTGRDAQLICELLTRVSVQCVAVESCEEACRLAGDGVGAFLIADEVLSKDAAGLLGRMVSSQPSWSDLPVIVLTGSGQVTAYSEARRKIREPLGNVILVERPVRPETLISAVKSAIRARSRQYEVRDHLRHEQLAAEALRRSEKLAVAGRLAASIAHEINNPLESVVNLHYLMSTASTMEETQRYLALADQELARVVEIATQTLRFHRDTTTPAPVEVVAIMDSVLKLYQRRIASLNITIERRMSGPFVMMGFAGELRQVFANLISNALDAMPRGGKLHLRVRGYRKGRDRALTAIRVLVADTGSGIPADIRATVLEPFVSTKNDKGTGLGLWVSSEIVRKHHGVLRFKSCAGRGSVFSIFLPLETAAADVPAETQLARTGS